MTYSFVVCVKDRQALLTHCLTSVSRQNYRDFEVIVVDYGSTEPISASCLDQFTQSGRLLRMEKTIWNGSIALNAGIANANGKYLVVIDCDTILAPDLLTEVAEWMAEDDHRQIYWQRFDLNKEGFHIFEAEGAQALFAQSAKSLYDQKLGEWQDLITHGSFLVVQRSIVMELGGYDERMVGWGAYDNDLALRLETKGFQSRWGESLKLLHLPHEVQLRQRETLAHNLTLLRDSRTKEQLIRNEGRAHFDRYR